MGDTIKWLFFDIGSTLIDESTAYENRIKKMLCGTEIELSLFYEAMIGYYRQNKKGDLEAARQWGLCMPEWASEDEKLYPKAFTVLKSLSTRFKIGVIANQPPGTEQRLQAFGILKFISLVISSTEEGVAKPDKRIFEIALERANCRPESAIMIGDRIDNDILPAKAMGMNTIWIRQGFSSYTSVAPNRDNADYVIDDLSEIEKIVSDI